MIDMSSWDELVVDVIDDLHLDPSNVRLELPFGIPEADIIHDLFANEKAFSLVESIVKVGFLTHEVPIVLKQDERLIVVEGNRRVAALKVIQNPYLAPDYQARVTRLVKALPQRDALRKITVKRAPNRDDANQLIAALHTGNQRVAWSPARQAAFFQAQLDAGKSPAELVAQYPTGDVRRFVIRSGILQLFRSVEYKDPSLKDFVGQSAFSVSTLARLYEHDKFRKLLRIEIGEGDSSVSLHMPRKSFAVIAEKIVEDIKSNRINTRKLGTIKTPTFTQYMDSLRELVEELDYLDDSEDGSAKSDPVKPTERASNKRAAASTATNNSKASTKGSTENQPGAKQPAAGSSSGSTPTNGDKSPAKSRPYKPKYLDVDGIEVPPGFPQAIRLILGELSSINIEKFPNATFDLLRTFLEKSIKAFAESKNVDIRAQFNVKGYVYLSHCLSWLEQYVKDNNQTAYIQVITKVRNGSMGGYVASMSHLNAINHNHLIFATPDEVRDCWMTMQRLFVVVLKA